MTTEVSAASNPSNTGMKKRENIQQSCVGYDATACKTVAATATSETARPDFSQQIRTMSLSLQPQTKATRVNNHQAPHTETMPPCLWENPIYIAKDTE